MPSITEDQRAHCKLAQVSHALSIGRYKETMLDDLLQISDVNNKILNKLSGQSPLIGGSPLHIACFSKHAEAFDNLLKRGADFTAKNKNGDTVLHQAFFDMFPEYHQYQVARSGILKNALVDLVLKAHVEYGNFENPCSANGLSHFHIACAYNHLSAVQLFLNSKASVNEAVHSDSAMFSGFTPLHFAARFCGFDTAKLLLESGANARAKDAKGLTPLHLVTERNLKLMELRIKKNNEDLDNLNKYTKENENIIGLFLKNFDAMDIDDTGFCGFHAACTLSDSSLAEMLIRGVDVNCAISDNSPTWPGYTALHFAAHFNIDIVKLLLKKGANIEAEDAKQVTPFDISIINYGVKGVYDILSAVPGFDDIWFSDNQTRFLDFVGAMRSSSTCEAFFQTVSKDVFLPKTCPLWPGQSLSHLSVLFSKYDYYDEQMSVIPEFCAVTKYLSFGDHGIIQDARGRTPLHLAFYRKKSKIVDVFFENELGLVEMIDTDGLSHLHIACERGNANVVQTLLSQGANVNIAYRGKNLGSKLNCGSTPLHIAVSKGSIEIMKMLLQHGADVYATDADGFTPMQRFAHLPPYVVSMEPASLKILGEMLLPSTNLKNVSCNKTGMSDLHFASFVGNECAVEGLLKLGADPNVVFSCSDSRCSLSLSCFSGYSPLHFAVRKNHIKVIKILLEGGADILYKKANRMTLLYDVLSNTRDTFKRTNIDYSTTRIFASMIANNAKLRKRVEDDSGLTLLHMACYLRDPDEIKSLLTDSRVDVNAQMHADSPIWPKATPLHVLIECMNYPMRLWDVTVELLLDSGADVMLTNSEGDTPVHKAWSRWCHQQNKYCYIIVGLLLHRTDFSINPVNEEGISHFHLACIMSECTMVEKFLQNGIDVNLPLECRGGRMVFQTPLQLTMESINMEARLQTVDVLLKYGADVNTSDERGLAPLHNAARKGPGRELLFEKLCDAGADINCTGMSGESVLEMLLNSVDVTTQKEIEFFFGYCNLFNTYNSVNGIGIISMTISNPGYFSEKLKFFFNQIIKIPSLFTVDQIGRTPIHNMVAIHKTNLSYDQYANYIEKFIDMGYNIDAQDTEGKTALHLAAYFSNDKALHGLLVAGADINITDSSNRTALFVLMKFRLRYSKNPLLSRDMNNRAKKLIWIHTIAMLLCGLDVNSYNSTLTDLERGKTRFPRYCENVLKEFGMTKFVKIGTGSLTARDFLSETGAVASRPMMASQADRDAVDKFFKSISYESFPYLRTLLKLQYRQSLIRLRLMEEATHSVRQLLGSMNGFSMPELCCRIIIRFLTNTEVKHLIKSVLMDQTA